MPEAGTPMTANPDPLEKIVNTIRSEVPKYLSPEFVINHVTAENLPGPDDEEHVRIRVILEYDHAKLDPHASLTLPAGNLSTSTTPPTPSIAIIAGNSLFKDSLINQGGFVRMDSTHHGQHTLENQPLDYFVRARLTVVCAVLGAGINNLDGRPSPAVAPGTNN